MSAGWGPWHEGERYNIRLGNTLSYDEAGYHTRSDVEVLDKQTGIVHERVGDGRQIGNFHPIWISWQGERIQLEELLRRVV